MQSNLSNLEKELIQENFEKLFSMIENLSDMVKPMHQDFYGHEASRERSILNQLTTIAQTVHTIGIQYSNFDTRVSRIEKEIFGDTTDVKTGSLSYWKSFLNNNVRYLLGFIASLVLLKDLDRILEVIKTFIK